MTDDKCPVCLKKWDATHIKYGECPKAEEIAIKMKGKYLVAVRECERLDNSVHTRDGEIESMAEEIEQLKGLLRAISDEVKNYKNGPGQMTGSERLSRIDDILVRVENPSPEHGGLQKLCEYHLNKFHFGCVDAIKADRAECIQCKEENQKGAD